ncbi:hypothetical protein QFC21_004890 [Naganishia friedmannii]|uniref:Uncharacterized protein n=1 Tax=Naganishia friedmannii TaxID=89922 RepID=A0ACC2VDS0_9TREE|nr:hypothetical protein QFC21_004890 [Naganishia friedmannii]
MASSQLPVHALSSASDKYPKPQGVAFTYGTAGFRTKGDTLESTLFRIGLLAVLRSKKLNGQTIGVMITASHNPAIDNGAKLVDPRGEMLDASWEQHATLLANAETTSELLKVLTGLIPELKIDWTKPSRVVFGRDTRPSGEALVKALKAGLEAMGCHAPLDMGITTTPCLHYMVKGSNLKQEAQIKYGVPSEQGYVQKLATAFTKLMKGKSPASPLIVDCANGVGAVALAKLSPLISDILPIRSICTNTSDASALNHSCGADYVKTNQKPPPAVQEVMEKGHRACSLDGDADRVVYYYLNPDDGKFRLLDGDKIATLAAGFIGDLVKQAGLSDTLKIGVVQTAYANGSSTQYLQHNGLPVRCVPTGVKHLHHAAERYNIGVYFEANGHGTVLFSEETIDILNAHEPRSPAQETATQHLLCLVDLINQAVGDAISDFLMVEVILAHKRWGPVEWDQGYEDLPNRLVKVNVTDRFAFKTQDAERRLVEPKGLAERVDAIVNKFEKGRSFVRPSGTEDCVRVYAEASTRVGADELAAQVATLVSDFSNGDLF